MAFSFFPSLLDVAVFEITFSANLFFDWGRGPGKSIGSLHKTVNRKLEASFSASFG